MTATNQDAQMEQELSQLVLVGERVSIHDIDNIMAKVRYDVRVIPNTTTVVATAITDDNFTLCNESTSCVDPRNFNQAFGEKYAKLNAEIEARKVLWMLEGWRLKRRDLNAIAKRCHEVNRAYSMAIGDDVQLSWEQAPQWQRDSAINGVKFHIENPDATPEQSHNQWMVEKKRDGWVYGPIKDEVNKTHPCMKPYGELPLEQRVKDTLFLTIVKLEINRL